MHGFMDCLMVTDLFEALPVRGLERFPFSDFSINRGPKTCEFLRHKDETKKTDAQQHSFFPPTHFPVPLMLNGLLNFSD